MTVQTHPQMTRELRLSISQGLLPARDGGRWLGGFGNMLGKELGEWFRNRRWLRQLLIWLAIISGIPAVNHVLGLSAEITDVMMYFQTGVLAGAIGMIILSQDEIILEKQSGTVAWILSKPASRSAFILAKLLANTIGALVFIIAIPGLVTLGVTVLVAHQEVALVPFLGGTGVFMLMLFFYLSLVIMLGVLFESRGPVLGIAFGLMFGGVVIGSFVAELAYVLPMSMDKIALLIALGMPLPAFAVSQMAVAAGASVVFVLVALWRFQHREF